MSPFKNHLKSVVALMLMSCTLPIVVHAQNLVSSLSWTVGSGSVGIFQQNGDATQNFREMGTNPYGTQAILWKAVPDAPYNTADGGWTTTTFAIDKTKLYRFSVWLKKTGSASGTSYFGTGSNDLLNLDGSINSNAYFWWGDLPELNKWYLLVGYIHPSTDPSTASYGGMYDGVTGTKVLSLTDFRFSTNATISQHRTYLYYDDNVADRQYFYGPEVTQMSDNTPLVETSGSTYFNGNAFFGGSLGIGVTSPYEHTRLQVKSPTAYPWGIAVEANPNRRNITVGHDGTNGVVSVSSFDGSGYSPLQLRTSNTARVTIDVNGKVGIGTISPDQQLTVKGKVHAEEVIIDTSVPAPDYVFEQNYPLTPLDEVQAYIAQHKHLPEVPSAKEMEKDGVKVGEMEMILLKKMEEMTLYLINQNNEIKKLNALVGDQAETIQLLKEQVKTLEK